MKNLQVELLEAALTDIKKLVKENPNDMDLGKQVRKYFNDLPELLEGFQNEIDNLTL